MMTAFDSGYEEGSLVKLSFNTAKQAGVQRVRRQYRSMGIPGIRQPFHKLMMSQLLRGQPAHAAVSGLQTMSTIFPNKGIPVTADAIGGAIDKTIIPLREAVASGRRDIRIK
jgi:hypothetical protein